MPSFYPKGDKSRKNNDIYRKILTIITHLTKNWNILLVLFHSCFVCIMIVSLNCAKNSLRRRKEMSPYQQDFCTAKQGRCQGGARGVIALLIFWNIALISKFQSYFLYFEVRKRVLHHQFETLKLPLENIKRSCITQSFLFYYSR